MTKKQQIAELEKLIDSDHTDPWHRVLYKTYLQKIKKKKTLWEGIKSAAWKLINTLNGKGGDHFEKQTRNEIQRRRN